MAKKTFKNTSAAQSFAEDPAMRFITQPEEEQAPEQTAGTLAQLQAKAPEGFKANPLYVEKKTKRVQIVLQPSLYEKAKAKADKRGISFNEYIHIALENEISMED